MINITTEHGCQILWGCTAEESADAVDMIFDAEGELAVKQMETMGVAGPNRDKCEALAKALGAELVIGSFTGLLALAHSRSVGADVIDSIEQEQKRVERSMKTRGHCR